MNRRGFSLPEMLLAVSLVAVAILGLVGVFISGVQLAGRSRDVAAATEVAREQLERVKLNVQQTGFGYIPVGSYTFDGAAGDPPVGGPAFPPGPYPSASRNERSFDIEVSGSELSPTLKEIRVTVSWGTSSRVTLETRMHP